MSTGQGRVAVLFRLEGNRRFGISLYMCYRLCGISTYGLNGHRKGDDDPGHALVGVWHPSPNLQIHPNTVFTKIFQINNKTIVDIRLRPRCRHMTNSIKHNVVFDTDPTLLWHITTIYIIYCNVVREDRAATTVRMHGKFREICTCGFWDTRTDTETNKETDRQTHVMIAILSTPTKGIVKIYYYGYTMISSISIPLSLSSSLAAVDTERVTSWVVVMELEEIERKSLEDVTGETSAAPWEADELSSSAGWSTAVGPVSFASSTATRTNDTPWYPTMQHMFVQRSLRRCYS